jgi:hypothetical protein
LFAGVPLLVKEVEDAAGLPTSHGSLVFKDKIAEKDCAHVARLREAGAVIVGKLATSEFGFVAYTATKVHGENTGETRQSRGAQGSRRSHLERSGCYDGCQTGDALILVDQAIDEYPGEA